ncbi:hypothetical protein [Roseovarius sp. E0-M6]|uniref:hypothetical protein n=1 Tax=Roseovarius sp. E0-M6 TaxID=3127118 RepID=UPI0030104736
MVAKSKIDTIEARIDKLHAQRFVPPLMKWIEQQDIDTLETLRERLEAGQDIVTAMKGLPHDN